MAALRHGITTVIIPKDNERDLEEIDQTVRNALNFVIASDVETVLNTALIHRKTMDHQILGEIPGEIKRKGSSTTIRQ